VQVGQHQLEGRNVIDRVHVDRNAATVVFDRAGTIQVHGDPDQVGESGEGLVDRVVDHLEHAVMQTALVRVADVHVGTFAHALQPLEFLDLRRIVISGAGLSFGEVCCSGVSGMSEGKRDKWERENCIRIPRRDNGFLCLNRW
jgi:hypothetical protein